MKFKAKYIKPVAKKTSAMQLVQRPLLAAAKKVGCFQCSSCHGCR